MKMVYGPEYLYLSHPAPSDPGLVHDRVAPKVAQYFGTSYLQAVHATLSNRIWRMIQVSLASKYEAPAFRYRPTLLQMVHAGCFNKPTCGLKPACKEVQLNIVSARPILVIPCLIIRFLSYA